MSLVISCAVATAIEVIAIVIVVKCIDMAVRKL
jgi:hypothetical protein